MNASYNLLTTEEMQGCKQGIVKKHKPLQNIDFIS